MVPSVAGADEGSNSMGNEGAPCVLSEKIEVDPSKVTASDWDAIKCLAQAKEMYESRKKKRGLGPGVRLKVNDHLCGMDPSKLPRSFVISVIDQPLYLQEQELNRRIDHQLMSRWIASWAAWAPAPVTSLTAIRGTDDDARYVGTKQLWKLRAKDGTNTGCYMVLCYSLLSATPPISCHKNNNDNGSEVLYLDEDLVLCNVFELKPTPAEELPEKQPTKRRRVSKVWEHFTKIKTNGPKPELVYAACKHCNKILHAHSKDHGTKSLSAHVAICTMKHPQQSSVSPLCHPNNYDFDNYYSLNRFSFEQMPPMTPRLAGYVRELEVEFAQIQYATNIDFLQNAPTSISW